MKRVVVPLARGFEEIEAVVVIDILRRADAEVKVAGVGGRPVTGAHGITVECACLIEDCGADETDAVVLPGGIPGTTNLAGSEAVRALVVGVDRAGGIGRRDLCGTDRVGLARAARGQIGHQPPRPPS
jgi:4-methyl-5(b-hydroxyethyl)-thiazole monophosphate biosynthesis